MKTDWVITPWDAAVLRPTEPKLPVLTFPRYQRYLLRGIRQTGNFWTNRLATPVPPFPSRFSVPRTHQTPPNPGIYRALHSETQYTTVYLSGSVKHSEFRGKQLCRNRRASCALKGAGSYI